jgi:hypothetical protein
MMEEISEGINFFLLIPKGFIDEEYWYDKEKHFVGVFFSFDDNCHLSYQIQLNKRTDIFNLFFFDNYDYK